jgi:hypothetical protein
VEAWPARNQDVPGALIALLEPVTDADADAGKSETLLYLQRAAQHSGLDFFHHGLQAQGGFPPTPQADLRHRAMASSAVLDQIMHLAAPHPRWGINE